MTGLKNAADLMYDVSPKVLGVIQPPLMPNMRFSKYVITDELICWGSFGVDPDIFDVANPTFYVHQTQIDEQPNWMNSVRKPVLEFLSNVDEGCLYAQVPRDDN